MSDPLPQPAAEPRQTLLRSIGTVARRLRTLFDARAGQRGLTQARSQLLILLDKHGSLTQAQLAEEMEVERPTIARLVEAMESGGMLRREVSETDRRYRNVVLTEASQAEVLEVRDLLAGLRAEVLEGISDEDLATVDRVLTRMLDNIGKAAR